MRNRFALRGASFAILIAAGFGAANSLRAADSGTLLTGKAAMGDWKTDAPGVRRNYRAGFAPAEFERVGNGA
jgi:hypothetical protein